MVTVGLSRAARGYRRWLAILARVVWGGNFSSVADMILNPSRSEIGRMAPSGAMTMAFVLGSRPEWQP